MSQTNLGAALDRLEDERLIVGKGRYVDDIVLPGTLSAAFLRSPEAHARITLLNLQAARAIPGVVAAYALEDLGEAAQKQIGRAHV